MATRKTPATAPPPQSTATTAAGVHVSPQTREHERLLEHRQGKRDWKRWGPYVSDRAWGTVREDYSSDGSAWTFLTHDMARSKAARWGEDGIAGLCDEQQTLCFSLALWNEHDPILKERYFGLSGVEGNHGEDVKELYYYLDATPTHSYMKMLYKYPQAAYPYGKLVETNANRSAFEPEYELLDTGAFHENRYWDVFVEYAKASPEEIFVRITATNRGPEAAFIHLLPQIWFRNDWAWGPSRGEEPQIERRECPGDKWCEVACRHRTMGERFLYVGATEQDTPTLLFTNNETNSARLYNVQNIKAYVKDAFHDHVVSGKAGCVSPQGRGTKAAAWYTAEVEAGGSFTVRLVLTDKRQARPFASFEQTFERRIAEADEFYESIHSPELTAEERRVQRQALAGMLWNKMFYLFDVKAWQDGDNPRSPPPKVRKRGRDRDWRHLSVADIISMPDKWEYPWFAAWDSAFHAIPLAMVDLDFAKDQLELLLSDKLLHPNGQIPAYEWEFSDVNPPVQAWAVWRVYNAEKHANGERGDLAFLARCYHKLLLNFTWWVNRKDSAGRNIFQGGFLGLDNISVFDRSQPLPGGGYVEQADATGWMGLFCLNLMSIGLELAQHDPVYEHLGIKFFEHFMSISAAINQEIVAGVKLWDEQDGWYYDVAHGLDGKRDSSRLIKVRSQVGLVPLFAAQVLEHSWFEKLPNFKARYEWILANRPELTDGMVCVWTPDGTKCLLSIVNYERLKRVLARLLDESEFLSPYGLRSLSRYHLAHPYVLTAGDREWTVRYEPAESTTRLFGGNSNWRGPIWFPTAFMLVTALRVYDRFFAEGTTVECPRGSGRQMTLNEVAIELGRRLCALFLPDRLGHRPVYDARETMQNNAAFRDHVLFYEFFNGDTGEGLGASHQTGWTGLVAKLLEQQAAHRREMNKSAAAPATQRTPEPAGRSD
jgi:hypothetical protein